MRGPSSSPPISAKDLQNTHAHTHTHSLTHWQLHGPQAVDIPAGLFNRALVAAGEEAPADLDEMLEPRRTRRKPRPTPKPGDAGVAVAANRFGALFD